MPPVFVTNTGDFDHSDSYDGVSYSFPRGKSVEVPEVVAENLFGYGHESKFDFVVRLGWTRDSRDLPEALAKMEKFLITPEPVQDRSLPSAVGAVSLQAARSVGRKAIARAA